MRRLVAARAGSPPPPRPPPRPCRPRPRSCAAACAPPLQHHAHRHRHHHPPPIANAGRGAPGSFSLDLPEGLNVLVLCLLVRRRRELRRRDFDQVLEHVLQARLQDGQLGGLEAGEREQRRQLDEQSQQVLRAIYLRHRPRRLVARIHLRLEREVLRPLEAEEQQRLERAVEVVDDALRHLLHHLLLRRLAPLCLGGNVLLHDVRRARRARQHHQLLLLRDVLPVVDQLLLERELHGELHRALHVVLRLRLAVDAAPLAPPLVPSAPLGLALAA
mmetsp:Transcript_2285/g.7651  ORF Transcript_2285/g.7651 Transcript_2285/m.7651 type:complete len:274 (-) Transcript_2285:264-1085(-)